MLIFLLQYYELQVSYFEIYMEKIKDLLDGECATFPSGLHPVTHPHHTVTDNPQLPTLKLYRCPARSASFMQLPAGFISSCYIIMYC